MLFELVYNSVSVPHELPEPELEREAVEHIYFECIARDTRHTAINLNWEQEIGQRSFPDWSMGFPQTKELAAMHTVGVDGYLAGGMASLDLSGPASDGRTLLLSIYSHIPK